MKDVFVETNWVVDYCAPAHQRVPAAVELLQAANAGIIKLHLPSPCISESRSVTRLRFQPREADSLRKYLKWAKAAGHVNIDDDEAARRVLEQFEVLVKRDLDNLEKTLEGLRAESGIEVFPLSEAMLERAISLSTEKLELKPFDNSILAAILVRAEELVKEGHSELAFCELDGDLQPWGRDGVDKPVLKRLYDEVHVWVYGDFTMTTPEPPLGW
jgi:predicted nucleic acid-binding protein